MDPFREGQLYTMSECGMGYGEEAAGYTLQEEVDKAESWQSTRTTSSTRSRVSVVDRFSSLTSSKYDRFMSLIPWRRSQSSLPLHGSNISPDPIVMSFHFADRSYVKMLDFGSYKRWVNVARLQMLLGNDGVQMSLYVEDEADGQGRIVGPGDWEARVRPGQRVVAFCHDGAVQDHLLFMYEAADECKESEWENETLQAACNEEDDDWIQTSKKQPTTHQDGEKQLEMEKERWLKRWITIVVVMGFVLSGLVGGLVWSIEAKYSKTERDVELRVILVVHREDFFNETSVLEAYSSFESPCPRIAGDLF
ncbi:hypothetical protein BS50DRAFT_679285 [Corynespora cassiicola Philippines]|uniref:Uncharacterized protein n=1 Tax=Corynespora cassiicola Philippines TaxID=1448308 RepID=A0A2T2NFD8_CORCC|nr:hypothetical protein BS50DRAFT_679285 [Corynespora cassiicola Philippines]